MSLNAIFRAFRDSSAIPTLGIFTSFRSNCFIVLNASARRGGCRLLASEAPQKGEGVRQHPVTRPYSTLFPLSSNAPKLQQMPSRPRRTPKGRFPKSRNPSIAQVVA